MTLTFNPESPVNVTQGYADKMGWLDRQKDWSMPRCWSNCYSEPLHSMYRKKYEIF